MTKLCECNHPKSFHNGVGCGGVVELRTTAIVKHAACECKSYRLSPPAEPKCEEPRGFMSFHCSRGVIGCRHDRPPTTEPAQNEGTYSLQDLYEMNNDPLTPEKLDEIRDLKPNSPPIAFTFGPEPPTALPAESVEDRKCACDSDGLCKYHGELEDRAKAYLDNFGEWTGRERDYFAHDMASFAQSEIERQTPAIIERDRDNWKFKAQLLVKQLAKVHNVDECLDTDCDSCSYIAEITGEIGDWSVDAIIERFITEVEKEYDRMDKVEFDAVEMMEAMQTVKARRSGGEGK